MRGAAVFGVTAVEAFLNWQAAGYVQRHPNEHPTILAFLAEKDLFVKRKDKDINVLERFRAVNLDVKIREWTKIITGNDFDCSDQEWQKFRDVKDFRNALIHYKPDASMVYMKGTVQMAKDAVDSSLAMILRFYSCADQEPPSWTSQIRT